mmetsp:Transcript_9154/g.25548  ORF Transcript_9154/g.25548 Transcript_9154/m.25548 type:complete len:227 (-) Transcript_9154:941-1621(-)
MTIEQPSPSGEGMTTAPIAMSESTSPALPIKGNGRTPGATRARRSPSSLSHRDAAQPSTYISDKEHSSNTFPFKTTRSYFAAESAGNDSMVSRSAPLPLTTCTRASSPAAFRCAVHSSAACTSCSIVTMRPVSPTALASHIVVYPDWEPTSSTRRVGVIRPSMWRSQPYRCPFMLAPESMRAERMADGSPLHTALRYDCRMSTDVDQPGQWPPAPDEPTPSTFPPP